MKQSHPNTKTDPVLTVAVAVVLALAVLVLCSACNTVAGMGADLHDIARGTQYQTGQQPDPYQPRR